MPLRNWFETQIWKELESRGVAADAQTTSAKRLMPLIETLLQQGDTAPVDFTLHDAQHAFRVAERMVEVMPNGMTQQLANTELLLLLYAAYLHDIGMTPIRERLAALYTYMLTGSEQEATRGLVTDFAVWLDNQDYGITPGSGDPDYAALDEALAYYARHKHNDWSAEWIRTNLSSEAAYHFTGWTDLLVTICASHHWGREELLSPVFEPRLVSPDAVVNPRYLACVLRVSDILENDPERTPDVIFRHRKPVRRSEIFWWKDHHFATAIIPSVDRKRVVIHARPPDARIHKAVLETARAIESELVLCRQIAERAPFSHCVGMPPLPHAWSLDDTLSLTFAADLPYEYIEGAFRPNTRRILDLLTGRRLYETPFAAIRELLQNAFDAVREQLAYERLAEPTPSDDDVVRGLSSRHIVRLSCERRNDAWYLVCEDSGIGMTKQIIESNLLVSGAKWPPTTRALETRCRLAGFELGRIGEFGIGALSYFMIADEVEIETRRGLAAGDSEPTGWHFETQGVGSFGELRRSDRVRPGTRVALRLRKSFTTEDDWFGELIRYVKQTVVRTPCKLVVVPLGGDGVMQWEPGWVSNHADWSSSLQEQLRSRVRPARWGEVPDTFVPSSDRDAEVQREEALRTAEDAMLSSVRWFVREAQLLGGRAIIRIIVPMFVTSFGASAVFFHFEQPEDRTSHLHGIGPRNAWRPTLWPKLSVKGFEVTGASRDVLGTAPGFLDRLPALIELDIVSGDVGGVSVDRNSIRIERDVGRDLSVAMRREVANAFRDASSESELGLVNRRAFENLAIDPGDYLWPHGGVITGDDAITIKPIQFPAISSEVFRFRRLQKPPTLNGEPVTVVRRLEFSAVSTRQSHWDGIPWASRDLLPDRVVCVTSGHGNMICPMWSRMPTVANRHGGSLFHMLDFPPEWADILMVKDNGWRLLNKQNHIVTKAEKTDAAELLRTMGKASVHDAIYDVGWLLKNPSYTHLWFLVFSAIVDALATRWQGVCEHYPEVARRVFKGLGRSAVWIWEKGDEQSCYELRVSGGRAYTEFANAREFPKLRDVGPEWTVVTKQTFTL
jgi:hypothetical protein